jgi:lipopolysaccharide transport system permease protein
MNAESNEVVLRPRAAFSLADLADVWRYRELLWTLAVRDVTVRYKQAGLGVAWALLQPILQMFVFTLVFNRLAGIRPDRAVSYPLYCFTGLVVWTLFAAGLSHASESLVNSANLITKVYFPRVIVPLAALASSVADFLVAFVVLLILMPLLGAHLHVGVLLAPLVALVALGCAFALGLWTSAINIQFRDVRYALPFFIQLLIFLTPVFLPASLIPARWRPLLLLNPMAAVVDAFRAVMLGDPVPWLRLLLAAAAIVVIGALGFLFFRRMERDFADRV